MSRSPAVNGYIARISDAYPEGRSILLVDAIRQARYREGSDKEVFLKAGEVAKNGCNRFATWRRLKSVPLGVDGDTKYAQDA